MADFGATSSQYQPIPVPDDREELCSTVLRKHGEDLGIHELKEEQKRAIWTVVKYGKDVAAWLPTGYGKTIIMWLIALILGGTVLIISPLQGLMREKVEKANKAFLYAVSLADDQENRKELIARTANGKARIGYINDLKFTVTVKYLSPETALGSYKNAAMKADRNKYVCAVFLDEAQCVTERQTDFRPDYGRMTELRLWLASGGDLHAIRWGACSCTAP
ncbi:hypothetical protein HDU93_004771 [Gonapodya sp. JEL0774]|nr:hypothetical protein HDU93_004771 [Gonapodya sp. JEL0774]